MAHFAELDKENRVARVIVVSNLVCVRADYLSKIKSLSGKEVAACEWEDKSAGVAFCEKLYGGRWVQTSYNGNIRRRYAGIGYTYDEGRDAFIAPPPFMSWTLDKVGDWQPPIAMPDDGEYSWDEKDGEWVSLLEDILGIA